MPIQVNTIHHELHEQQNLQTILKILIVPHLQSHPVTHLINPHLLFQILILQILILQIILTIIRIIIHTAEAERVAEAEDTVIAEAGAGAR